jgi:hypothetical protein
MSTTYAKKLDCPKKGKHGSSPEASKSKKPFVGKKGKPKTHSAAPREQTWFSAGKHISTEGGDISVSPDAPLHTCKGKPGSYGLLPVKASKTYRLSALDNGRVSLEHQLQTKHSPKKGARQKSTSDHDSSLAPYQKGFAEVATTLGGF